MPFCPPSADPASVQVVILVPVDVWAATSNQEAKSVAVMWQVIYWSTQAATWLLVPMHQQYSLAGDFTPPKRLLTALKNNLRLIALIVGACLLGLLILIIFHKGSFLKGVPGIAIAASNAFGLGAGILLLSYGLVDIPRSVGSRIPSWS